MLTDITLPYELVDILQLQDWIKKYNNRLGTIIEGCGYEEFTRKLTVISTEELLSQDLEDISSAVLSYTNPATPINFKITNTGLQKVDVASSDFKTILQYEYSSQINERGSDIKVHIRTIPILDANTSDMTYTLRVVNVNHNMVIGSITSTNNEYTENVIVLDDILQSTNPFLNGVTLEIQVKTDSPGSISILSAHILYI